MYVIWNLTRVCPWNCRFCCVSAMNATKGNGWRELRKGELTLEKKMKVLSMIAKEGMIIDFSGGDPVYFDEDRAVVERATELLPASKINVSMTGCEITKEKIRLLKKVNMIEFTLDNLPSVENPYRPRGFNLASMKAMRRLVDAGIMVSAVTILYGPTISLENLGSIYEWLCLHGVQEWDILKFYPVGRGMEYPELEPSDNQYLAAINYLRSLDGPTHISFQHSLRVIEGIDRCHAAVNSIGVLPDGEATACAWALDQNGCSFDGFRIGKLPEESLGDILKRAHSEMGYSHRTNYCRAVLCACGKQRAE